MKKKSLRIRQNVKKFLQTFLVLIIFAIPLFTTGKWLSSIFAGGSDTRKVMAVAPLNERSVNTQSIRPFEEPVVSITFDDGWESIYSGAVPIMQKHGITSTQYIITGTYDDPAYMSLSQLHSLKKAGTEISSHTVSHKDMTSLTDIELEYELKSSKISLEKDFGTTKDFTSPLGAYNTRTIQAVKKYYRSHKNAEGDPAANGMQAINVEDSFNVFNIVSYSIRSTTTDQDIEKLLQLAAAHNAWLVLTYHQVDSSELLYAVTPEVFERHMNIVSKSPLKSAPVGEFINAWELR